MICDMGKAGRWRQDLVFDPRPGYASLCVAWVRFWLYLGRPFPFHVRFCISRMVHQSASTIALGFWHAYRIRFLPKNPVRCRPDFNRSGVGTCCLLTIRVTQQMKHSRTLVIQQEISARFPEFLAKNVFAFLTYNLVPSLVSCQA